MSSTRRTANETNILAMLDRHESGGRMRRLLRGVPAMAWYGAAGLLVAGLVSSLAWLALDRGGPPAADSTLAGAVEAKGRTVAEHAAPAAPTSASASASASAQASAEVADEIPTPGATIVDLAPTPDEEAAPPLDELRVLPPQQRAGRIAPRDGQREAPAERQRLAAHAAGSRAAPRSAAGKPPAPARGAALAHAEARSRRTAAQAKPAPAAVDTDVALISAIIQHANKRQEAEEATGKQ